MLIFLFRRKIVANCSNHRPFMETEKLLRNAAAICKKCVVSNETDVRGAFLNYMSNFTH